MATISISHPSDVNFYQLINLDDYYSYQLCGWKKASPKKHVSKTSPIPCTPMPYKTVGPDVINEVVDCGVCGSITLTWIKED